MLPYFLSNLKRNNHGEESRKGRFCKQERSERVDATET